MGANYNQKEHSGWLGEMEGRAQRISGISTKQVSGPLFQDYERDGGASGNSLQGVKQKEWVLVLGHWEGK